MTQHAILTAIGTDRPGLVDEVSRYVFERGGNIEDSRMVNLRGQFAIMMLVGGPEATIRKIEDETARLESQSRLQHVEVHPAAAQQPGASAAAMPYRLTATAIDQPGLVQRIAHLLRTNNVNIESMQTTLSAAPITGAPVFEMELIVSVPSSVPIGKLRETIGGLCDELNIDWELRGV